MMTNSHPPLPTARTGRHRAIRPGVWLAAMLVAAFLLLFLVLPVAQVIRAAFVDGEGSLTFAHFSAFFGQGLMRESFFNSLWVALASTLLAALIALPLAFLTVRFEFRGARLIQALGVLPLIMPPFVGAAALQLLFGPSGAVNLLLERTLAVSLPLMEGLGGVIFVESIHYFPFILMNTIVALRGIDAALEDAALNLGCTGWRQLRRVTLPLALPGLLAGASLVFVKVFDDLGTPLVLGQTNLLAPQAYLRITRFGLDDPMGYVIAVMMILFSVAAMTLSARLLTGNDLASQATGATPIAPRPLRGWRALLAYGWVALVLLLVLAPHVGVLLLSFAQVWSYSPLPDGYTLAHYATVFQDAAGMMQNTLLYCGLAAGLDVLLGMTIAWLLLRTRLPARQWLDWGAMAALAVPGVVLALGYLRLFHGVLLPGSDTLLTHSWLLLMLAYAVRRLPYALRASVAALQQVHATMEEAAENLGAGKLRTLRRVVIPLMAGGLLAGFVTSFITAAVELSATMMLVSSESQAPMSYGVYLYMQSVAGHGPGAALGVLAILVVALGTALSWLIVQRSARRADWRARRGESLTTSARAVPDARLPAHF